MLEVTTGAGRVRGERIPEGAVFRGIPYAAPPTGPRRWERPAPAEPWAGVRECSGFGPPCPQGQPGAIGGQAHGVPADAMAEDCLTLNVWTPAVDDGGRPTMVWVHGGGFLFGSSSRELFDGAGFARDDVVLVSLNYRLHALGFLYLDELCGVSGTENVGLFDQLAALRWVRDNIAAFGGDPDNVTVFGESAGAQSIAALLGMGGDEGLFRRAALLSGNAHACVTTTTATEIAAHVVSLLDVPPDIEALRRVPAARVAEAALRAQYDHERLLAEAGPVGVCFLPVVGGDTLPARPVDLIARGAGRGVDLLLGSSADEWRMPAFGLSDEARRWVGDFDPAAVLEPAGRRLDDLLPIYEAGRPGAAREDLVVAVQTDQAFTIPTVRVAEGQLAHNENVWMYRFSWPTPILDGKVGACHALAVSFAFETMGRPGCLAGPHPPDDLGRAFHGALVRFAGAGDPGGDDLPAWPRYDVARRAVMDFGTERRLVDDPCGAERRAWSGILEPA
ncbi:MAG: carboxylesterase family protein [Actinobacteria bacterium]|nr:carboxylesterase family protein [Actinomycetota bacterium]